MRTLLPITAACVLFMQTSAHAVNFTEISRINVDSTASDANDEFIGSNPSAVAWDGTQLYVAGFNNSGGLTDVAIVEVTNATTAGVIDATYDATKLGVQSFTSTSRGYASLDISPDGTTLAAGYDDGSAILGGFAAFNTSDNSTRWQLTERGSSGVAFDPGFNGGNDQGVGFGMFSSGRRALYDPANGNVINGFGTTDLIWYSGVGSTLTRDIDFDPDTGDIYARAGNDMHAATRSGADNTVDPTTIVDNASNGAFVNGQNLSFLSNTTDGDLVIYNDRSGAAGGQVFGDIVKVVDPTGGAVASTFTLLNGDTFDDGVGYYDFDFDPVSQTLALLDFANRNVHIFSVGGVVIDADFDGDSDTDLADLLIQQRGFGVGTTNAEGDTDADGDVDDVDQANALGLFGTGSAVAAVGVVPEPTSLMLAGLGLLALARRRS